MIPVTTVAAALGAVVCFVLGVTLSVAVVGAEYEERRKNMPHGFRMAARTDMLFLFLFGIALIGLGLHLVVEVLA